MRHTERATRWYERNRTSLWNAASIMSSTVITSVLGLFYWGVAARAFSPTDVGIASALTSAIALIGTLGNCGIGPLLVRELAVTREDKASLLATGLWVAAGVSGLLGLVFAMLASRVSSELAGLTQSALMVVTFVGGSVLSGASLVFDEAIIGLLRGDLQLRRNVVFAAAKLLFLIIAAFWFAQSTGLGIFATWVLGMLASFVALAHSGVGLSRSLISPRLSLVRRLGAEALGHHLLNAINSSVAYLMPVLVTAMLSASANASFYAAWMISGLLTRLSYAFSTVLYAMSSEEPSKMAAKCREALRTNVALTVVGVVLLWLSAPLILGFFGESYAQEASIVLRLLVLGELPRVLRSYYVAIHRVHRQATQAARLVAVVVALELVLSVVGMAIRGLLGLAIGYLVAEVIQAFLMGPYVYRACRERSPEGE